MSKNIFGKSANVKKSVTLINDVDPSKFPLLLARVAQKLHLKNEHAFSEDEEEKLRHTLGLELNDLNTVIDTSEFFLLQAAYHSLKPQVFAEHLTAISLSEEKASVFMKVWSNTGKEVTEALRKTSILPVQLSGMNWELGLQMAQASRSRMAEPTATVQLTLNNSHTQEKEKVSLEFNHSQMYALYNQLETIQGQLDDLT